MKLLKQTLTNFLCLLLLSIAGLACSKKDEPAPTTKNEITFNGKTHTFITALMGNFGFKDNIRFGTPTHQIFDVMQADDVILVDNDGRFVDLKNTEYLIMYGLFVPEAASLPVGTFTYISHENDQNLQPKQLQEKYNGKYYFSSAWIHFDLNGNNKLEPGEYLKVVGGKITTSGTEADFTIDYDWVFNDGKTLKGRYKGDVTWYRH